VNKKKKKTKKTNKTKYSGCENKSVGKKCVPRTDKVFPEKVFQEVSRR
jgi:hypothetical protein